MAAIRTSSDAHRSYTSCAVSGEEIVDVTIVSMPAIDSFLKESRITGDANHMILFDRVLQVSTSKQAAADEIQPDRLATPPCQFGRLPVSSSCLELLAIRVGSRIYLSVIRIYGKRHQNGVKKRYGSVRSRYPTPGSTAM